ncbi:MAG: winged helix-turn-helix transcriptional regulator [Hyphomicrobiaceae bacterium]
MATGSSIKHTSRDDNDSILLSMLDAIADNPNVTQRRVASELGIAVGLANSYVKRCVRKGLVKISQAPAGRYAYYLTPKGFSEKSRLTASYLSNSLSFFRRAREQCDALLDKMAAANKRRAVLLGGGDLAEIIRLIAPSHKVDIVAVVAGNGDVETSLHSIPAADWYVVTSFEHGAAYLEAAIARFGAERVVAPPLMRLSSRPSAYTNTSQSKAARSSNGLDAK